MFLRKDKRKETNAAMLAVSEMGHFFYRIL
jgi:hypothetical protein